MMITMKPLREILGDNIARAIKDSQLSVREIASRLNISETSIHRWKSGDNPPDVNNLESLAKILGVDPADFYKHDDNVIPIYGHSSLRKYLVIPDEIVEDLSHFGAGSPVWDKIRLAIKIQNDALKTEKKNHA